MIESSVHRRLAAILAADVVGYSKMMGDDEAGTLAAVRRLRAEVIEPKIAEHQGRLFKSMGDGFLVEFPSVVNAAACAAAIQMAMAARNADQPEGRQLQLRIGVHLGDVISEGGDVYGDGVNIAARIEGLAPPGGVAVSAMVHDNIGSRLDLAFEDMGEQHLKNIAKPLRVYRLATTSRSAAPAVAPGRAKPSIAVLPFTNMSGDVEQEYFSDGLTEDIITELSRFKGVLVAARNSSFSFKGKSPKITDVGRELGVQYVLEGSVRKAGTRVRVTGQLIDATSGGHIWAERYDRDMSDIFALQDELVHTIAGVVPGQIDRASYNEISRRPPANLTAYECELRGRWALSHWSEGLAVAHNWYLKAAAADPDYALAHAGLAMVYSYGLYVLGFSPEEAMQKAKWHASRALSLEPQDGTISAFAAFAYHVSCEPEAALQQSERAVQLNPNDYFALYVRACALTYGGRPEEALEWYARSERLKPYDPDDQRIDTLLDCYYLLGQHQKALKIYEHYQSLPAFLYLPMASNYARLEQMDKARAAVENYYRVRPEGHDPNIMAEYQARMCLRKSDSDYLREGYRLIGLAI